MFLFSEHRAISYTIPQIVFFQFNDPDFNVNFFDICFVRHLLCKDASMLGWAPGGLYEPGVKVMTSKPTETVDLSSWELTGSGTTATEPAWGQLRPSACVRGA